MIPPGQAVGLTVTPKAGTAPDRDRCRACRGYGGKVSAVCRIVGVAAQFLRGLVEGCIGIGLVEAVTMQDFCPLVSLLELLQLLVESGAEIIRRFVEYETTPAANGFAVDDR